MSVKKRLIERRMAADLERKEAAHKVSKSYQYIRQLEEGPNEPPTWALLGDFARAYGTSVDYLLGLTDDPRPPSSGELPEGAKEVIDYLSSMSSRGREMLLKIAKVIYQDDAEFQRQEDMLEGLMSILGETTIAAIQNELPAVLAEPSTRHVAIRRIRNAIRENFSGDFTE